MLPLMVRWMRGMSLPHAVCLGRFQNGAALRRKRYMKEAVWCGGVTFPRHKLYRGPQSNSFAGRHFSVYGIDRL